MTCKLKKGHTRAAFFPPRCLSAALLVLIAGPGGFQRRSRPDRRGTEAVGDNPCGLRAVPGLGAALHLPESAVLPTRGTQLKDAAVGPSGRCRRPSRSLDLHRDARAQGKRVVSMRRVCGDRA